MPERIKVYLYERGLSETILKRNHIAWDGERIVIPVFDANGVWMFNKYRRDPDSELGPKYTYDKGSQSSLYGADKICRENKIIICEGEFDALILETQGFTAVSSTGGAGTFKEEWLALMLEKDVYVCYDHDDAGYKGIERITKMMPMIKTIWLPHEVGEHGDITDYFIKLKKTKNDFKALMNIAVPLVLPPEPKEKKRRRGNQGESSDRLKAAKEVPLDLIIKFNRQKFAKCPFHKDNTASLHWFGPNRWKCFGCSDQGDAIDLVMRLFNMPMKDAIDHLLHL